VTRLLSIAATVAAVLAPTVATAQTKPSIRDILTKPTPAGEVCNGDFGTNVHFVKTPSEAGHQALKEEKLLFVLHVSGNFEDPDFT